MRLGRLVLNCVGSGGQWIGRTDCEGMENPTFNGKQELELGGEAWSGA